MYTAKKGGGGTQIHHGDGRPDPHGQTPLALLAELRKALETREITIHVQPQAHVRTRKVYGAEALVRWNHPTLGLLPPAEFLTLADRHALLHDLTVTVLTKRSTKQPAGSAAASI
jgi:sensor c-di-GMP phosphodiesterase-like protein